MAVSFSLVDLKFLVQQSFSLTPQQLRSAFAKVNKTYEQYRHYNAFVIVLLVRKIPMMKFIYIVLYLSPVGSQEAQKILPARGTACIFSLLCPNVTTVCFTFYFFCTPNQSYTPLSLTLVFLRTNLLLFVLIWSCTSSWQDLKGLLKYYQLKVQLACLVHLVGPIFITVFFTFVFSAL